MRAKGLIVERPVIPTVIELSHDESELKDPSTHPVKVRSRACLMFVSALTGVQVTLKRLNEKDADEEIVRAKFVVGADGT